MRVMVLGSSGFIGSAVVAALRQEGHRVVEVVRPGGPGGADRIALDLARAGDPAVWRPHLAAVDAVVNCAGVFQASPRDSTDGAHVTGPAALFQACATAGVRRVIQLSGVGVDRDPPSDFSRSKAEGDRRLMGLDLDWVILRPSVVLGRDAAGSGALLRGLAALPVLPVIAGAGPIQPVQLADLVATIRFFLAPGAPARLALEIVGPERLGMEEVARQLRAWLGWRPAREATPPAWLTALAYRLGDLAGRLGWRPPIRSNARLEMARGAAGDPGPWTALTGIRPQPLAEALAAAPATVQERWFARLYLLRPLSLVAMALFWIGTGLVSLGPGYGEGLTLLAGTALAPMAPAVVIAGGLADLLVGLGILVRRTARGALLAGLAISVGYALAGTIVRPDLWADPLAPLLKVGPLLMLNLVALAILDER